MITFAIVCFLMFVTPGPGALSLAGVGAAFGWRQGFVYMVGLFVGHAFVSLAVISGVAAIILAEPVVRTILLFCSIGYLGYLAFRIALAGSKITFFKMLKVPGFVSGMSLQFINPKAYAVHTTFFTGFAFYPDSFIVEISLKLIIIIPTWILLHTIWLYSGCRLHELQLSDKVQKWINIFMALCLCVVISFSIGSI